MQGVQDQPGRLVAGVVGAVAEEQPGLVEAADRPAQPVAHGQQLVGRATGQASAGARSASLVDRAASGSSVGDAMCSFSLWMLALTGPNSTTSRADVGDEAAVRGAAGGGQLGARRRHAPAIDSRQRRRRSSPARREEGLAAERPARGRIRGRGGRGSSRTRDCRPSRVLAVEKRKLNSDLEAARHHVVGAGAGVEVGDLPGGRREVLVAAVPVGGRQLGQRRRERDGSGSSPARDRRHGPARPCTTSFAESEPRRPFLIVSPSALDARSVRRRCSSRCVSPRALSASTTAPCRRSASPSSSEVSSSAIEPGACGCAATKRSRRRRRRRSRTSCRRRRGRRACRRARSARTGRSATARAGRSAPRRCGRRSRRRGAAAAAPRPQIDDAAAVDAFAGGSRAAPGARRCRSWQPASSGVTERRAISCAGKCRAWRRRPSARPCRA